MGAELGLKERKKDGRMGERDGGGGKGEDEPKTFLSLAMRAMRMCQPKIHHFGRRIILS